ncbi:MAG: RecX family transcriptional regulator [Gemmatimonadaceae bacterium]|nr:RecX family transcriptional regulator [Gemmatimonadaceae bacterium]
MRADAAAQLEAPVTVRGLAEHPRIAGRYRVRVASAVGEAELLLGASGIGDFALRAGRVLDDDQWRRVQREARIVAAQDAALRSLATGRRSERDLVQRVRRRERDAAVVADAIERLRVLGVVDDAAFAEAEAAAKLRRGTVSTGQVRRELRRRGVAAELADDAISVASEEFEVDDAARCREAAAKRARQLGALAPDVLRRRLGAWLMRRGFAPGTVAQVVREVLAERGTGSPDDTMATDDDGEWRVGDADD